MDAQPAAIAEACLRAAEDGTMPFPAILGALEDAGFDGYLVDYRGGTTTYYLADGASLALRHRHAVGPVAPRLDGPGLAASIRWAQSGAPDYAYEAFSRRVAAQGCAGYLVSLSGRRVLYLGRDGATHAEEFPAAAPGREAAPMRARRA